MEEERKAEPDDPRVVRAVEGDPDALEELLRAHAPAVRAALEVQPQWRRSLEPEDVLQVTWLEAFLRVGALRVRTDAGFRAWLVRVAENNLRDAVRGLQRSKRPDAHGRVTHGPDGESARTLLAALAEDGTGASTRLAEREALEHLRDALARLPETYRRVVESVDLAERDVAEVAVELGRSPGAVYMLRSRAHDRLRELLGA
jgi:RNA polymerase sigma-70 factor (ECF subfamily)